MADTPNTSMAEDAADEVRCEHCGVVLTRRLTSAEGRFKGMVKHTTDVCIRNLLVRLVANDDRRMKFPRG